MTAGLRNGEVRLFDVRTRGDASSELFGSRFSRKVDAHSRSVQDLKAISSHSAVVQLQEVNEWQMLVGTSAGEVRYLSIEKMSGSE